MGKNASVVGIAVAACALAVAPASAQTILLSRSADGATPNGPSRSAVISQDKRFARVVAFESDASDIVPGTAAGVTNVFAIRRDDPYGENGDPWRPGATLLLSRGRGGEPANGPSWGVAVSGTSRAAPRCVAFVSAASNLVPGDTNGVADAFVYDLSTGSLTRVSVSSGGRQANGPTDQVTVDGLCTRVAFTSRATNLALTRTRRASWKAARTTKGPPGIRQVYVRFIGGTNRQDLALMGLTMLASATSGRAGDGPSFDPVFAPRGRALAFASEANDLGGGDSGDTQVFLRELRRHLGPVVNGRRVQGLELITRLVSRGAGGQPGNGPSSNPALDATGFVLAYETRAGNLVDGDLRGHTQIVRTRVDGDARHHAWVSTSRSGLGDGSSHNPTVTDGGTGFFFDTAARNLRPDGDQNPAREVLFADPPIVISTGLDGRPLPQDAARADTSPHLNYVMFDAGGFVYLRYMGPK